LELPDFISTLRVLQAVNIVAPFSLLVVNGFERRPPALHQSVFFKDCTSGMVISKLSLRCALMKVFVS